MQIAGKVGSVNVSLLQTSLQVTFNSGMGADPYIVMFQPDTGIAVSVGGIQMGSSGFTVPVTVVAAGVVRWMAVFTGE